MRKRSWLIALAGLPLLVSGLLPASAAVAAAPVQVMVDGQMLSLDPAATIVDERTLVPVRALLEAMGAELHWDGETRSVEVIKGDKYIRLKIDRRLACLNTDCTMGATLDVPARLINDRTFVPARFISQALGYRVSWDAERRAVLIDTKQAPDYSFTSITIPTLTAGQTIEGKVPLRAAGATGAGLQFYLIDPATGAGPLMAAGSDTAATYTFTPDPTVRGPRLVVAAVKDASGVVRYSDPVRVVLDPKPAVAITGIEPGATITGPVTLGWDANFVATDAVIDLVDAMGNSERLGTAGNFFTVNWYPQIGHNGPKWLKVTASDRYKNSYVSKPIPVQVESGYRTSFTGVAEGATLTGPVTLSTSGNFPIEGIKYVLDDRVLGWGFNYAWNVGPELNGTHKLSVEILAKDGSVRTLGPYNFSVNVQPRLWLSGVGPNQVVTGAVTLSPGNNLGATDARYYLTGPGATTSVIGQGASYAWTPTQAGNYTAWVTAKGPSGNLMTSEKVSFRVYLGTIYSKQPLVKTPAEFKALAMQLAVPAYRDTGMAASLQVAQSILETGWGSSIPVDKYTGQFSYNLFGIKGAGPAGSVTITTWEEYNGKAYTIDDGFRAYHSAEESWRDHKSFLLMRAWYAPFRAVMTDPVLGAYGLRKSGYATDSGYPGKLIKIMIDNDLFKLDNLEL
jgi:hypothetical protein